jgi:CubicO group peptidase (beta-lactamase class C family)
MACGKPLDIEVNEDQPYHTASIGKAFTATLVALLVHAGKLSLDDPISRYVPQEIMQGLHVYKGRESTPTKFSFGI